MKFRFIPVLQIIFIGSYFILTACSSGLISFYYVQQQSRKIQDSSSSHNFEELTPPPAEPLEPGKISMFSVILRDGNIAEPAGDGAVAAQLQGKLGGSDASYTGYNFSSDFFDKAKLVIENISDNIPSLKFAGQINWNTADKNENGLYGQWIPGDPFTANGYGVSSVEFRRAHGSHPFGFYTNSSFEVYGEDGKPTGEYEPLMKRFVFFYFTGSSSGQSLKNGLVAVDTYSKLVFQFAKPVAFREILGFKIPTLWAPVDSASTWQGKHKPFYEYDPVGYVTENGVFYVTERYKNNMRNANYDPDFTGLSPYLGYVGNSAGEDIKPASSGFLTVKPKYLENVSVTDARWDHGNADGSDWPEFIYGIRSRAYAGITPCEWNMLAAHKPDSIGAMPNKALHIKKGTRFDFNTGSTTYEFTMNKEYRTLELDSRILELDISGNDTVTDYGKPALYLQYDGFSQSWKVISETLQNTNGTLGFDKNFTLKKDETKELILTIPAPGEQQMKLCYELGWTIEEKPGEKPLFGVEVYKTVADQETEDKQYTVSGKNGEYTVEYTDQTFESAQAVKEVCFSILLTNLKPDAPVPASFTVDNGGGFIKTTVLKADNAVITSPAFTPAAAVLDVTLSMDAASERADKEGSFTLTFNPPETYNESSPDKIKVKIIRRAYKPKLSISNITLENISVWDIWGDYPAGGGYEKAEFSYEIMARCDAGEWDIFSTNNGAHLSIDTGKQADLQGKYILPIDRKTPASHKVDISCKIQENDPLKGNADDVIIKHEKPLFTLLYNDAGDNGKGSWSLSRNPDPVKSYNEGGYWGWYWSVKSITLPKVQRGKKERMTILISAYIYDSGVKDWGDMELSFDVEWK